MITYHTGNLLDAPAQALVNTVNTVGVMGKGVALQFRERFKQNYAAYLKACKQGELSPGHLLAVEELTANGPLLIINFPTKTDWRRKSTYGYVEAGLRALADLIGQRQLTSVALPPLGCGHGGLDWERVRPLIEQYLGGLPTTNVLVYEPNAQVKALLQQKPAATGRLTPARAMLLYSLFAYESLGEEASIFAANKLAYFLQRLGEPLKLQFKAHHYGPYSPAVQHVLYNLNGKYIQGLEQNEAKAFEPLALNYGYFEELGAYIAQHLSPEQQHRLNSLLMLIDGFQSSLSLEVLASVDFLQTNEPNQSIGQLHAGLQTWSERKRRLISPYHVQVAYEHLQRYKHQESLFT
ncbi:macro domain-containing protein [Hymenobacter caeli]|uniref:O-acetyl-ADP-ribose deacetylase (Regulator of RNase III) n=1 Tax=Hymenobacter caeli TaxID=2735894 RepID=A0ABX2FNJ8_9BACT|nr:macro domain-containing protein [Hymenobacter caeli]NRT18017.1 O-acetyl-ADP-ribose deacetylase (regulator of RNase III) [Hymenobacter caeli]